MASSKTLNDLPDIVLQEVFRYLSLQQLGVACVVCKKWKYVVRLDSLWKKFIPKYPGFVFPLKGKSAYETVRFLWRESVHIGKERWYPNPLPELVEYERGLRKAEKQQTSLDDVSETTLFLRLNPCYKFTTKGKDKDDVTMVEMCKLLWEKYGYVNEYALEITSYKNVMELATYQPVQSAMKTILISFQPFWYLEALGVEEYELDDEGNIIDGKKGLDREDSDEDDEEEKGEEDKEEDGDEEDEDDDAEEQEGGGEDIEKEEEQDENAMEEDEVAEEQEKGEEDKEEGGNEEGEEQEEGEEDNEEEEEEDEEQEKGEEDKEEGKEEGADEENEEVGEQEDEDEDEEEEEDEDERERNSWKLTFNKLLSRKVYRELKAIVADGSDNFIEYLLSDGCMNENDSFAYSLIISDTAVVNVKQVYEL